MLEATYQLRSELNKALLERARQNAFEPEENEPPQVWQPLRDYTYCDVRGTEAYYRSFSYACIKKRATNITKGRLYLYKEFKSKRNEIKDHPFLNLLKAKNSYGQSFKEIIFLSSLNCDLYGNAYIAVNKIDLFGSKIPVELIPVPAKYVTIHLNSQNTLIDYYECVINNQRVLIPPENMIRFKIPNPNSNIYGFAPVSAFNFTLDIDFLMSRTQKKFFTNFAQLGTVIETPQGTTEMTRIKLDTQLQSEYSGASNSHKGMVLSPGLKVTKLADNNREMDYVKSRLAVRDEICVILDCDKVVMNITDDVNYNNSKSALRNWIENNISPFTDLVFAQPLTHFVKENYDSRLIVEYDYEFMTDREMQMKSYEVSRKYGLKTINEIRELEGDDPLTDPRADDPFAPLNSNSQNSNSKVDPVNPDTQIQNN